MGPMLVLPAMQKSGPLPAEELPPVLNKIIRPALYGSQWRSGINNKIVGKSSILNYKNNAVLQYILF